LAFMTYSPILANRIPLWFVVAIEYVGTARINPLG